MENNLFRKKSLDHISSPEEMHDYMRVTSPRVWMILGAVLLLLAGFIIYIATARMESTYSLYVEYSYGMGYSVVPISETENLRIHMPVRIEGHTGVVSDISYSTAWQINVALDSDEAVPEGDVSITFETSEDLPEELRNLDIITPFSGNGLLVLYSPLSEDMDTVNARDWRVRINGALGTLTSVDKLDVGSIFIAMDDGANTLKDGNYRAEIVTESTTPLSFLLN